MRSGKLSKPSGSQIMSKTTAEPNTNKYHPCAKRNHSGKTTPTADPKIGPKK
jgi:hypothetical protein